MEEEIKKRISQRIKLLIELKGISQNKLAEGILVGTSTVSDWVKGKKTPGAEKIKLLADYLNVPIDIFYNEEKITINNIEEIINSGHIIIERDIKEISTINAGLKMGNEEYYYYIIKDEDDTIHLTKGTKIKINVKSEIQNDDLVIAKIKNKNGLMVRRVLIGKEKIVLLNDDYDVINKDDILCMYLIESFETKTRK